ncbi:MAG: hypothetical protein KGL39_57515 [Patescibacteria group bacterium]|nr:hypothetical protein [Patescibacteria group bacterium]
MSAVLLPTSPVYMSKLEKHSLPMTIGGVTTWHDYYSCLDADARIIRLQAEVDGRKEQLTTAQGSINWWMKAKDDVEQQLQQAIAEVVELKDQVKLSGAKQYQLREQLNQATERVKQLEGEACFLRQERNSYKDNIIPVIESRLSPLTWSTNKPDKLGWYWRRETTDSAYYPVEIVLANYAGPLELWVKHETEMRPLGAVAIEGSEWSGPLSPPEEAGQ